MGGEKKQPRQQRRLHVSARMGCLNKLCWGKFVLSEACSCFSCIRYFQAQILKPAFFHLPTWLKRPKYENEAKANIEEILERLKYGRASDQWILENTVHRHQREWESECERERAILRVSEWDRKKGTVYYIELFIDTVTVLIVGNSSDRLHKVAGIRTKPRCPDMTKGSSGPRAASPSSSCSR